MTTIDKFRSKYKDLVEGIDYKIDLKTGQLISLNEKTDEAIKNFMLEEFEEGFEIEADITDKAIKIVSKWLCKALDKNDSEMIRNACIVLKAMEEDKEDEYKKLYITVTPKATMSAEEFIENDIKSIFRNLVETNPNVSQFDWQESGEVSPFGGSLFITLWVKPESINDVKFTVSDLIKGNDAIDSAAFGVYGNPDSLEWIKKGKYTQQEEF